MLTKYNGVNESPVVFTPSLLFAMVASPTRGLRRFTSSCRFVPDFSLRHWYAIRWYNVYMLSGCYSFWFYTVVLFWTLHVLYQLVGAPDS